MRKRVSRMTHLILCEPIELYNILNQVTKLSRLTEPNYLCLLDVRSKREYDESHVITALLVKKVMFQTLGIQQNTRCPSSTVPARVGHLFSSGSRQKRQYVWCSGHTAVRDPGTGMLCASLYPGAQPGPWHLRAGEYLIPESVDLQCVQYCVVYDNATSSLEVTLRDDSSNGNTDDGDQDIVLGAAVECGRTLTHLTRHPIHILRGGYERFSAMYQFFRTQKIIWMPQDLDDFQPYPVEIIPGRIYLGNFRQACDPRIQKDLKIKAHVNISMETGPFFVGDSDKLLHIQIEDSLEANITPFLRHICHFIEVHLELGSVILVFSTMGISRSCAAILAYLMHQNEQTLKVVAASVSCP
ncbi:serine/threonine/tyrosine-interacting-like protein 1 isoform X3 [Hippopotamus amphibius kiboko]|uniref:serine/threonine/tyrosine-interacting-like protein 1 isoform X3 n=1 Tax=Hippopotamus amphibius kiboko TaxID=575201 RepID=UPI0025932CD6|nr:serine/threonine/tyrosine-interacting-like protein 1 isoform X3 [Hippopotamus amphibius kiboko]